MPSDDQVSGMICKSAFHDVYNILWMVTLLIAIHSKMQSNKQSNLKCQEERIFLSGLQMADQYNRWVIYFKPVSLNIRNIVLPIYAGFHGGRSLNWVNYKMQPLLHLHYFRIYAKPFALCCKLCSKFSPKALNKNYFKWYWTYIKILIIYSEFSKMSVDRRTLRFACM